MNFTYMKRIISDMKSIRKFVALLLLLWTPLFFSGAAYAATQMELANATTHEVPHKTHACHESDLNGSAVDQCFDALHQKGYKIYGTSPVADSQSIHELPLFPDQKIALVFGNEHEGISEEVKSKVDGLVHIPMRGFTESFNISVSASIFLFELIKRASAFESPNFHISEEERGELRLKWYKDIVPHADIHEKHFLRQTQNA